MKTQTATKKLSDIISTLGAVAHTCTDVRWCSRCNMELTDYASIERGQGPICARKDTHLYAKTIQVNWSMVTAFATMVIDENSFPTATTASVWRSLKDILVDMSTAAHRRAVEADNNGDVPDYLSGDDCRLAVKVIDWLLSFKLPPATRRNLIQLVRHLGYIALAGVLSGEASTGESSLKFEHGRVVLSGSSNKAGYAAMQKNVRGVRLPARRGPAVFSAPATSAAAFIDVATEFWPCFDAKAQDVLAQANKWVEDHKPVATLPTQAPVVTDGRPVATLTKRSADMTMTFEWSDNARSIIDQFKRAIPATRRAYDAAKRQWIFRDMSYETVLVELLSKSYRVDVIDGGATPAAPRYASCYSYHRQFRR